MSKVKMSPLPLIIKNKRAVRTQLGALCYRIRDGRTEFLLITSRGNGRWVIPKGWPMGGQTPGDAALKEAWEEAGVVGRLTGNAVGVYTYAKRSDRDRLPCIVAVFPIHVERLEDEFPESRERRRKWLSPRKAAARVTEPELRQIILAFDPRDIDPD